MGKFSRWQTDDIFSYFSKKIGFEETIFMKCQSLFFGKNKKNISKCHLLKFLPRALSVEMSLLFNPADYLLILM